MLCKLFQALQAGLWHFTHVLLRALLDFLQEVGLVQLLLHFLPVWLFLGTEERQDCIETLLHDL